MRMIAIMIIKKSFWYVRIIMIVDSYNRICQTEVINKDEIIKELKEKILNTV